MCRVAKKHFRVAALMAVALLAGCTRPSPVADPPLPVAPTAARPSAERLPSTPARTSSATATRSPSAAATATGTPSFVEQTAVPCGSYVTGQQIIALLRNTAGLIPNEVSATVQSGPVCSGTWQYTVVVVPERDPLRVVTSGGPSSLKLVTAGTDVCTVEVRAIAPAGIRAIAAC
jgi:hypothetical protein